MIYGKYDLRITNTDGMDEQISVFNHITRAGLNYLLRGEPKPLQPTLTAAGLAKDFAGKLNFMFFHVRPADMSRTIPEEDIYDIEFPDITDPNVRYTFIGRNSLTPLYSFHGDDEIIIDGIGIGYYEVGGTGENNFVFSYTHIDNGVVRRDLYPGRFGWQVACEYTINNGNNSLMPSAKFNIGGIDYEFRPTIYRSVGYFQNTVTQSGGLFLENGAKEWSIDNAALNKTTFQWAINGKPCVPANSFEELTIQNEKTKKASRVFRVKYKNNKPFAVHVTGFKLSIGAFAFAYRAEVGKYIVLPAGKAITLNLSAEIFNGKVGTPSTTEFGSKYMATREIDPDYIRLEEDTVSNIIATVYEGTSKEKVTATPNRDGYTNYLNAIGNNDTLTKYVFQYLDGSRSTPIYMIKDTNPSSYSFAKPQVTSVDGWVVNEDDVCFRISAPSNVNFIEFASIDGVWERFTVTPNAVNFIKLSAKFLYEPHMYIRWASATATGLILVYEDRTFAGNVNVPIEFVYGETANPHLVLYPSRTAGNSPIGYTTSATYVEGTTPLTTAVIGSNPDYYALDAPYGFGWITPDAKFMGPLPNSKWFDPINMKLVAIPRYDEVYPYSRHDVTKSENPLVREKYNITPVKSNEVSGHLADNHPKVKNLTLVKKPTETKKQVITGYLSGLAKGIELFNSVSNEVLASYTGKEGSPYTLEHTKPMYDHIPYGLRYLDELGQNISSGKEYYIYGIELAPPEPLEDVYYDADQQLLNFVTPERATRATIKRWGIELYSFECVKGGTSTLYSSEVFDTAGNYILTLYNSEGVAGESIYIFGYNENDVAIKPDTTGPYAFTDWTYSNSNYTSGNLPFMDVRHFESGLYHIKINNKLARVAEIKRNEANLITQVIFEADGEMISWNTGYHPSSTSYDQFYDNYNITVLKANSWSVNVVIWHEWELYTNVGIDKFVKISSNKFNPVYGKSTSYYQFSEVSTGYVRNSLMLLLRTNSNPTHRIPYSLDSTFKVNSPNANIYLHTNDILGSTRFIADRYQRNVNINNVQPYINNVPATWEPTYDDNYAITKLRMYNDECAFVYDTTKPSDGWVLEGFNPELIGDPEYKDKVYVIDFFMSYKYTYTSYFGASSSSTGGNNLPNMRYVSDYYREQLTARVAPYMTLMTYEEDTSNPLTTAGFSYQTNNGYRGNSQWSEAYISIDSDSMLKNSIVIIDGVEAVISTNEVTILYTPLKESLLTNTQLEKPPSSDNVSGISANQEPYTYTAYTFTTPMVVISNDEHPNVWKVKRHGHINITDNTIVRMAIVRNKILQPNISSNNWWTNTYNVCLNYALTSPSGYDYSYITAEFSLNYPKVMKYSDSPKTVDIAKADLKTTSASSMFLFNSFILGLIWDSVTNDGSITVDNNIIQGLVKVNGEVFDIVISPDYIGYAIDLQGELNNNSDIDRALSTLSVFTLTNTDGSKVITGYEDTSAKYEGFNPGEEIFISFNTYGGNFAENNVYMQRLSSLYNDRYFSPINTLINYSGLSQLGFNMGAFWNYVPHRIPSGQAGQEINLYTYVPEATEYDEWYTVVDRTKLMQPNTNTYTDEFVPLRLSTMYLDKFTKSGDIITVFDHVAFTCNGITHNEAFVNQENELVLDFTPFNLRIVMSENKDLAFRELSTGETISDGNQYILKVVVRHLELNTNHSLFNAWVDGYIDMVSPLLDSGNVVAYDDYNGTERIQSIYIAYGIKPQPEVEVDSRIGASPFPPYGVNSTTYMELPEIEQPS